MSSRKVVRCGRGGRGACFRAIVIRFSTDGNGGLVEDRAPCRTCDWGICLDCDREPVNGTVGKALRCEACWLEHRRVIDRRSYANNVARRRAQDRARTRRRTPEQIARRRANRLAWNEANAEYVKRAKAREYAKHRRRYLDYYRLYNEGRKEKMAVYNKRYTKYGPHKRKPVCSDCGEKVPWDGRGRPLKRCEACDPKAFARSHYARRQEAA